MARTESMRLLDDHFEVFEQKHYAEDADDDEVAETELELDERMKAFEELMERRPFLVNEVLLRRNPNDVQEWEKRVLLWGENDDKVRLPTLRLLDGALH